MPTARQSRSRTQGPPLSHQHSPAQPGLCNRSSIVTNNGAKLDKPVSSRRCSSKWTADKRNSSRCPTQTHGTITVSHRCLPAVQPQRLPGPVPRQLLAIKTAEIPDAGRSRLRQEQVRTRTPIRTVPRRTIQPQLTTRILPEAVPDRMADRKTVGRS